MRLAETQEAKVSKVVVYKDDPGATRVTYIGMEPIGATRPAPHRNGSFQ